MCKFLKISRNLIYYKHKEKIFNTKLENNIIKIFKNSRNNYGTRKIKEELEKIGEKVSRRKISEIMVKYTLISNYTIKKYKVKKTSHNEEIIENILNRNFNNKKKNEAIVSDLTYVKVNGKWNYICILIDIYNREIIAHSVGNKKDSNLVFKAFANTKINLKKIKLFHTDRGNEFKNTLIDDLLKENKIQRSLSKKACPYDNSVAEATFKIIKTEFIYNNKFYSLDQLNLLFTDYVHWFNNCRIHSSLGYFSPVQFRKLSL